MFVLSDSPDFINKNNGVDFVGFCSVLRSNYPSKGGGYPSRCGYSESFGFPLLPRNVWIFGNL